MSGVDGAWSGLLRSLFFVSGMCVSACSTLPASGPTGHEIEKASRESRPGVAGQLPFRVVEVADASAIPLQPPVPSSRLLTPPPSPTDLVGPGDVLSITIYEAGVSLFGKPMTSLGAAAVAGGSVSAGESANAERLPGVRVDDDGFIRLPFVGRLRAAGRTASELQGLIRDRLRGLSQDPQVLISIDQSITNSVVLAGEVNRPGRFVLPTNHETLTKTIALAGGYKGEARDVVARVQRGAASFEIRLSDLLDLPQRDLPVVPGDQITLISHPESFSVLGAANRTEEIRFPRAHVSVAQAVALAGGANPNAGDAAAIFVFRYIPTPSGVEQPVVYHLNMMEPGSLLLSQQFMMNDKDLLYVGNARANQPSKLIQLLSQLFVPIATARAVTQ